MEDTDFHELGRQLFTEFGSMHQRVSRFADQALGGEMAVMRALMRAGGSRTPSELADRAWVSSARIANILRALEAKGWVEREHSKTDRRRVHVTVTDKGFRATPKSNAGNSRTAPRLSSSSSAKQIPKRWCAFLGVPTKLSTAIKKGEMPSEDSQAL